MSKSTYADYIKRLTGWDSKQYRREYNKFYKRAKNYEAITNRAVDIPRQFYYSFKYADDPSGTLQGILAAPATQPRRAGERVTFNPETSAATRRVEDTLKSDLLKRYEVFIEIADDLNKRGVVDRYPSARYTAPDFADVVHTAQALENDLVTPQEAAAVFADNAQLYRDWRVAVKHKASADESALIFRSE